ncbi:cytochrome b [Neptuniibacter halophilus]|uniref:cytochrome b n=1 Tax=Neptuniibacter halophilus TaxID=651666 RepID=UPI0025725400|nr:cytochrome b [Neptuniibacter halophilus]
MPAFTRLPRLTIGFHWIIAILMIANLIFGMIVEEMERSAMKGTLMGLHKSVGILVLTLAVFRLLYTLKQGLPAPLSPTPDWQLKAAKLTHTFLLAATIFIPFSGMLMSYAGGRPIEMFGLELIGASGYQIEWLKSLAGAVHGGGANLLIFALALHIAGAFKHSLIDRDGTLQRMLGRS